MYLSRTGYSPVGLFLRTNGEARVAIGKNPDARIEIPLPNTHNQWRYVTFDVDAEKLTGIDLGGENLAYLTVVGTGVSVDFDHVNLEAKNQLTIPQFSSDAATPIIGLAGTELSLSLSATDAAAEVLRYTASGLPGGARLHPETGILTWKPKASSMGSQTIQVTADNGTTLATRPANVVIAADRPSAFDQAMAGYDPASTYVAASLATFITVRDEVRASMATDGDSQYMGQLVRLQQAVNALQLLTPRLTDGSIDYRAMVATNPTSVQPRNLVDGDFNTTTGDLRAPFSIDFGADFRVSADAIGLQARYNFANRSEGANVYGSEDGSIWTLLTERATTNTTASGFGMETIPVRKVVRGQQFRFLKVQVDNPGAPTDPVYPGISSFSELRIHGERHE